MVKLILAATIALATPFVFAQSLPHDSWELVAEIRERASTPTEFRFLQQRYPETFGQYDARTVRTANYHRLTWIYRADTVCEPHDPRLTFIALAYGLCRGSEDTEACFQTAPTSPYPMDPCLE